MPSYWGEILSEGAFLATLEFTEKNEFYRQGTFIYRKVASRSTSRLVARSKVFRLFMKGKFDPYVL